MTKSYGTKISIKDNGCDEAELSFLVGVNYESVSSFDFQDDAYLMAEKLFDLVDMYIKAEDLSKFVSVSLSDDGRSFYLQAGDTEGIPTEVVDVEDIGDLCDQYEAAEVLLRIYTILDK